jgi:hypothetical protein
MKACSFCERNSARMLVNPNYAHGGTPLSTTRSERKTIQGADVHRPKFSRAWIFFDRFTENGNFTYSQADEKQLFFGR